MLLFTVCNRSVLSDTKMGPFGFLTSIILYLLLDERAFKICKIINCRSSFLLKWDKKMSNATKKKQNLQKHNLSHLDWGHWTGRGWTVRLLPPCTRQSFVRLFVIFVSIVRRGSWGSWGRSVTRPDPVIDTRAWTVCRSNIYAAHIKHHA